MTMIFKRFILLISSVALLLAGAPERAAAAKAADLRPVHVYFFTGGPVDVFSRETAKNIRTKLETYSKDLAVAAKFERHWFTHWRGVAKDIAESKGRDKIVLIGHSWGAAGAVQVAHHLNKRQVPIDLLVTIDTVPVPGLLGHARIPGNVQSNYNFYQASDLFAHTAHKNHRKNDESDTGIYNIQVLMGAVYSPHMRIDDRIEPIISSMVRMLMLGYLKNIRLPEKLDKQLICAATKELENYPK
jgi:pimeloyl-ACP methyl ester carboxylesterase